MATESKPGEQHQPWVGARLAALLFGVLVVVGSIVVHGFILSVLWGWFVHPLFSVAPALGIVPAIGVALTVALMVQVYKTIPMVNYWVFFIQSIIPPAVLLGLGAIIHFLIGK